MNLGKQKQMTKLAAQGKQNPEQHYKLCQEAEAKRLCRTVCKKVAHMLEQPYKINGKCTRCGRT